MKKSIFFLVGLLGSILFAKTVWGYDLTLTSVGVLSTLGTNYSVVNYEGGIPMLTGTASPSAEVGVKINTLLNSTIASTSGVWQFTPTTLDQGDNLVLITSGEQSLSFTLRFNATASAVVATSAASVDGSSLLSVGVWEYYIPAFAAGIGVYILGRFGKKRMQKWEKGD
jgi:hypothetical protein